MTNRLFRIKKHFKNLNYYSMPTSILLIFKKRLNFSFIVVFLAILLIFSFI